VCRVRTEVQVGAHEPGLKLAVTPGGRPEAERTTGCVAPPTTDNMTVVEVDEPRLTLRTEGLARIVKSNTWMGRVPEVDAA
jgi:hypothetical protein